ncbi:MAG: hypothetical protein U1A78_26120 [Polyangia bacterium]
MQHRLRRGALVHHDTFGTSSPAACNDTFGVRAPSSSGTALGSGSSAVPYAQSVGGLLPGTKYYYCAIAQNPYGLAYGELQSFTTPALAPTVSTGSASVTSGTAATLQGSANPNGDATTGWFRYGTASPGTCNDTFGTKVGGSALGAGTSYAGFSQAVAGLTPATPYYYCALASNALGLSVGTVRSFTTPSAPTATTEAASSFTATSAVLNGTGTPNRAATTGWFRYSTTNPGTCNDAFGSRAPLTSGTALGAGTTSVPYAQSISGLSGNTTYYYCAIVSSSEGTAFGAVRSFTTAGPPTVTTAAATPVASTSATLNGSGNPNGGSATGWFRYASSNPGTCNDTFGTRIPSTGGTALGAGTTSVPFAQALSGLLPSTTYYYCALANNPYGTGSGAVLMFTTPPSVPSVTTASPSNLTGGNATLNGAATPNGTLASGWFRIAPSNPGTCNDAFGTRVPDPGGSPLGSGYSPVGFSNTVTGLIAGQTYYYCAIAANPAGTAFGNLRSFTQPLPPTVTTLAATPIAATTATLNASSNPNGNGTTGWFRYATTSPGTCNDTFGTRAPSTSGTSLGSGTSSVPFAQPIAGLSPATTYYFCAIAASSVGTTLGAVLSFTTPPSTPTARRDGPASGDGREAPALQVTTEAASDVAARTAVLNATAQLGGDAPAAWFRYGTTDPGTCSDRFGARLEVSTDPALVAAGPLALAQTVSELAPATTYYFCAGVSSSLGTRTGKVLSLTTRPAAPSVTSTVSTDVASGAATLNGTVVPNGERATAWFRYSDRHPGACDDRFGTRAPSSDGHELGADVTPVAFSDAITGLLPGRTYYYCVIARNALGTTFGTVESFVPGTAAPEVRTDEASDLDGGSATLRGTVDPSGSAATGWFRYGERDPGACDDTFGSRVPAQGELLLATAAAPAAESQPGPRPYAVPLAGLRPGTTYYFCASASNRGGARFGQVRSFTTAPAPTPAAVPAVEAAHDAQGGCSFAQRTGGTRGTGRTSALLFLLPLGIALLRRRRAA